MGCNGIDVSDVGCNNELTGGLGGLPDPGHLALTGPWVLMTPLAVVDSDLRHTPHVADAIF